MKQKFNSKIKKYTTSFNSAIYAKKLISKYFGEQIKNTAKIKILIAGSGKANDFIFLKKYINSHPKTQFNFILLEINKTYLEESKQFIKYLKFNKNVHFQFVEETFIKRIDKFKSYFDIIICSEVIEHIWDYEKEIFFNNFNFYLKKNGLLLLSFPHQNLLKKIYYSNCRLNKIIFRKKLIDRVNDDFKSYFSHKGVPSITQTKSILIRKNFSFRIKSTTIIPDFFSPSNNNFLLKGITIILAKFKFLSTELVVRAYKKDELNLKM